MRHELQAVRPSGFECDAPGVLHLADPPLDLLLLRLTQRAVHTSVEAVPHELPHVLAPDEPRVGAAEPLAQELAKVGDDVVLHQQHPLHLLAPRRVIGRGREGLVPLTQVPPTHQPRPLRDDPPREHHGEDEQERNERGARDDEGTAEAEVGARRGDEGVPRVRQAPSAQLRQLGVMGQPTHRWAPESARQIRLERGLFRTIFLRRCCNRPRLKLVKLFACWD